MGRQEAVPEERRDGRGQRRRRFLKGRVEALAIHISLRKFFNPFMKQHETPQKRKNEKPVGDKMTWRRECHVSTYHGIRKTVRPYSIF